MTDLASILSLSSIKIKDFKNWENSTQQNFVDSEHVPFQTSADKARLAG